MPRAMITARPSQVDGKASPDGFEGQHNGYCIYTVPAPVPLQTHIAAPPSRIHGNTETDRTAPTPPTGRSPKTLLWIRWGNRGPN